MHLFSYLSILNFAATVTMHLKRLDLFQFKNYPEAGFDFSARLNCLTGPNGTGKTNILDAIHYLSMCKSFFNPIDMQNIMHGAHETSIMGKFMLKDAEENVHCSIRKQSKKKFRRNEQEYERLSDHIGLLPVVMIAPSDHELINGGSELRRKFIDTIISQTNKKYLDHLISYNRILSHRNALLKKASSANVSTEEFKVWDEQLIPLAESIFNTRKEFFNSFSELFRQIYRHIARDTEEVEIKYLSQLTSANYELLLQDALQKDLTLQYSTQGIHKDDISLEIAGRPVKRYGSQGQQKTFVIALKLAQFDFIFEATAVKPILLLDDIFDKLDDSRVSHLLDLVAGEKFGQLFVTHTNAERILQMFRPLGHDIVHHEIRTETQLTT